MLKKWKNSLKKNMAILVCLAFISVMFPDVTYAASSSSCPEFPFPKQYIFLFSSLFSSANHNIQLGVMAFTAHTILAKKKPNPVIPPPPKQDKEGDKKSNDDPAETNGNSKSKKKPKGTD